MNALLSLSSPRRGPQDTAVSLRLRLGTGCRQTGGAGNAPHTRGRERPSQARQHLAPVPPVSTPASGLSPSEGRRAGDDAEGLPAAPQALAALVPVPPPRWRDPVRRGAAAPGLRRHPPGREGEVGSDEKLVTGWRRRSGQVPLPLPLPPVPVPLRCSNRRSVRGAEGLGGRRRFASKL